MKLSIPKLNLFTLGKKKAKAETSTISNKIDAVNPNAVQQLVNGMVSVQDIIAPGAIEVDFDYLKIGNRYFRTLFVAGYPRFVSANWLALYGRCLSNSIIRIRFSPPF